MTDPLDAAAIRVREAAASEAAAEEAWKAGLEQRAIVDPPIRELIDSFIARVPAGSAQPLWRREWVPTRIVPRRMFRAQKYKGQEWIMTAVGSGWALRTYGKRFQTESVNHDSWTPGEDRFELHTVAVTTVGELVLVVVDGESVTVDEVGGFTPHRTYILPTIGSMKGKKLVSEVLNREFLIQGPQIGTHQFAHSAVQFPSYDPHFDFAAAHTEKLGNAMVLALKDL